MTHEQKPESAEFRTREAQYNDPRFRRELSCEIHTATGCRVTVYAEERLTGLPEDSTYILWVGHWSSPNWRYPVTRFVSVEEMERAVSEAEARGAAEQRRKDEERRELISANLDRPGLIEWSVHILGPDDVHPCGSRAEAEALAEETNILAGSTNKGRGDDEFVTYAAYVVPRFKADQGAEQRRKDAEGAELVGYVTQTGDDGLRHPYAEDAFMRGVLNRKMDKFTTPVYTRPANVAALEERVRELEGESKAWSSVVNNALTWLENGRKANARDELRAAIRRAAVIHEDRS